MNVGKIEYVEIVKGYRLNKNEIGCEWWKICDDCPYPDCIKGKKYQTAPQAKATRQERQAAFEACLAESCDKITGRG